MFRLLVFRKSLPWPRTHIWDQLILADLSIYYPNCPKDRLCLMPPSPTPQSHLEPFHCGSNKTALVGSPVTLVALNPMNVLQLCEFFRVFPKTFLLILMNEAKFTSVAHNERTPNATVTLQSCPVVPSSLFFMFHSKCPVFRSFSKLYSLSYCRALARTVSSVWKPLPLSLYLNSSPSDQMPHLLKNLP